MNRISKNVMYALDRVTAAARAPEPVILSGFWRSGTTWLQQLTAEAIGAKTIFEPLDQDSLIPYLRGKSVQHRGYIPGTAAEFKEADWQSLDLAFKGVSPHRSGFCYLCRDGLGEAFRPKVVVKFVRCQMVLDDLIQRYAPAATLHISRHPMPVVQSMLKAGWNWNFSEIDLATWYGSPLMPAALQQLADAKLKETHQKVAALWAITEQSALSARSVTLCRYESLVSAPEATFTELMESAGLEQVISPGFGKDSPVTVAQRKGISVEERLTSWRRDMPQDLQEDIRAVLKDFWPDVQDTWDLS